jgi:hypothetical protein
VIALHVQKQPTEPFGFVGFFSPESAAMLSRFYRSSGCEVELKAMPPYSLGGPCMPLVEGSAGGSEIVGSYVTPYFSPMVGLFEPNSCLLDGSAPSDLSPMDEAQGEPGE